MRVYQDLKMGYYVVEKDNQIMLITYHKLIAEKYLRNLLEKITT